MIAPRNRQPGARLNSHSRDARRTRGLCRVRDTMADVWCFNVDAKFERNGIVSSNTLK
jgi:hypothetical protein